MEDKIVFNVIYDDRVNIDAEYESEVYFNVIFDDKISVNIDI